MSDGRHEGLRNDALLAALDRALTSKDRSVFAQLVRASVAAGVRVDSAVARAFADELASRDHPSVIHLLREMSEVETEENDSEAILLVAAVHGLVACVKAGRHVPLAFAELRQLTNDERGLVRASCIYALTEMLARAQSADLFLEEAAAWMDDFGNAAAALDVLTDKRILSTMRDPAPMLALLDAAVTLIDESNRAAARKAGYSRLVNALPKAISASLAALRGGDAWLTERAATRHPDLRDVFERAIQMMSRRGASRADIGSVAHALDTSAKPRRDPTTDFGPSRKRGKRHRGGGR